MASVSLDKFSLHREASDTFSLLPAFFTERTCISAAAQGPRFGQHAAAVSRLGRPRPGPHELRAQLMG